MGGSNSRRTAKRCGSLSQLFCGGVSTSPPGGADWFTVLMPPENDATRTGQTRPGKTSSTISPAIALVDVLDLVLAEPGDDPAALQVDHREQRLPRRRRLADPEAEVGDAAAGRRDDPGLGKVELRRLQRRLRCAQLRVVLARGSERLLGTAQVGLGRSHHRLAGGHRGGRLVALRRATDPPRDQLSVRSAWARLLMSIASASASFACAAATSAVEAPMDCPTRSSSASAASTASRNGVGSISASSVPGSTVWLSLTATVSSSP